MELIKHSPEETSIIFEYYNIDTHIQTHTGTHIQTYRHTDIQTYRHRDTETHTHIQTHTHTPQRHT